METYVVTVVCKFDDVVVGCYDNEKSALRRMRACLANRSIRHRYMDVQSTDTGVVCVRVVRYIGARAYAVAEIDYE